MSDHHHRGFFKESYGGGSSKRYHSPGDSGGRMGGSGGGYFDSSTKRSRQDSYGGGSASSGLHTSTSSSSRYNDYSSHTHSSMLTSSSSRYKPSSSSSYYDHPMGGMKQSSSSSSKYLDDYGKGSSSRSSSNLKSSVRRIPPSLSSTSSLSSKMIKSSIGSSSSRPLPLMKVITSGSGAGRDLYGGSRLRTAPPEYHAGASYGAGPSHRKPEFKRPLVHGSSSKFQVPVYPRGQATAFRKGTLRTAASVSSKIRRRAAFNVADDRRKKRIDSVAPPRRDDRKTTRYTSKSGDVTSTRPKDRSRDSETKSVDSHTHSGSGSGSKKPASEGFELNLPGGEKAVVLEEVGGDSEEEENELDDKLEEKVDDEVALGKTSKPHEDADVADESSKGVEKSKERDPEDIKSKDDVTVDEDPEHGSKEKVKERSRGNERSREEREDSPSSRALLKLYCKYCDVRHVTFREYSNHLRSFPHTRAMTLAVTDMRKMLSGLRNKQRDDQRKLEKEEKVLSDTTSYCRVCELNFRSDPKEHEANELHNEIKTLIYQRCEVCDIDFRIWKVYLYHMAALEHVKRVAMKELKEAESKGENVKGTNLSHEELGLDLVEVRTVFYCNACIRYLPIKGDHDEAKGRHCMTLSHIKGVEEFRQREKRIAERQRKRLEREEREAKLKEKEKPQDESAAIVNVKKEGGEERKDENGAQDTGDSKAATDDNNVVVKVEIERDASMEDVPLDDVEKPVSTSEVKGEAEGDKIHDQVEDEDEDEIELHAGDDVPDDESEDTNSDWNRRTRSSRRGGSSTKKS